MKQISKVFSLFLFILIFTVFINPESAVADVSRSEIIRLTNNERAQLGLSVLEENLTLNRAAELKAIDMAEKGYFSHNSPDGRTPWSFIDESGYRYSSAGENLAVDFSDNSAIMRAWMNSPGHRANIVNQTYSEIGVAYRSGTYQGRPTIFVVQMFGNPAASSKSSVAVNTVNETTPVVSIPVPVAISERVEQPLLFRNVEVAPILIESSKQDVEIKPSENKETLKTMKREVSESDDTAMMTEEVAGVQLEKSEVIPQVVVTSEDFFENISNTVDSSTDEGEPFSHKNILERWSQKINEVVGRISIWWSRLLV